jgi:hypothetical protein
LPGWGDMVVGLPFAWEDNKRKRGVKQEGIDVSIKGNAYIGENELLSRSGIVPGTHTAES